MLAAVPTSEDRTLAVVQLAFRMVGEERALPDRLREYLISVITQALALESSPADVPGAIFPEAIQLALQLRERHGLRTDIATASHSGITVELAGRILRQMETRVAAEV